MFCERVALYALVFKIIADIFTTGLDGIADTRGCDIVNIFPFAVDRQLIGQIPGSLQVQLLILLVEFRFTLVLLFPFAGAAGAFFLYLQHRVFFQCLLDFCLKIHGRQLQQADCLLQLGCHRQMLAEF